MEEIRELVEAIKYNDYSGVNGHGLREVDFEKLEDVIEEIEIYQQEKMRKLDEVYETLRDLPNLDLNDLAELADATLVEWQKAVDELGKLL